MEAATLAMESIPLTDSPPNERERTFTDDQVAEVGAALDSATKTPPRDVYIPTTPPSNTLSAAKPVPSAPREGGVRNAVANSIHRLVSAVVDAIGVPLIRVCAFLALAVALGGSVALYIAACYPLGVVTPWPALMLLSHIPFLVAFATLREETLWRVRVERSSMMAPSRSTSVSLLVIFLSCLVMGIVPLVLILRKVLNATRVGLFCAGSFVFVSGVVVAEVFATHAALMEFEANQRDDSRAEEPGEATADEPAWFANYRAIESGPSMYES